MTAPTVLHPAPVGRAANAAPAVGAPQLTVVVPTFNEAGNVEPLLRRLGTSLSGLRAEVLFVDDSTDGTDCLAAAQDGKHGSLPVQVRHREVPTGGLSGAVAEGLRAARGAYVVVMDGDLQHPPELTPELYRQGLLGADPRRRLPAFVRWGRRRAVRRQARCVGGEPSPGPPTVPGPAARLHGHDERLLLRPAGTSGRRAHPLARLQAAAGAPGQSRTAGGRGRVPVRSEAHGREQGDHPEGLRFVRLLVALRWRHRAHPGPVAFASDSRIGAQVSDAAGRTPCDRLFRGRAAQRR